MEESELFYCEQCSRLIKEESRYCSHCGASQISEKLTTQDHIRRLNLKQAASFYAVELVICLAFGFVKSFQTLMGLTIFHVLSSTNALIFFILTKNGSTEIFRIKKLSIKKLSIYTIVTIPASLLISYISKNTNITLYSEDTSLYLFFAFYPNGKLLMLFFVAVLPALFEELAYRGYLLQALQKVVDEKQAIFISGFLFAIIHISFLSLFWLLPFALILGFIRVKENTIWYGVAIHFTFNLTACLMELYEVSPGAINLWQF